MKEGTEEGGRAPGPSRSGRPKDFSAQGWRERESFPRDRFELPRSLSWKGLPGEGWSKSIGRKTKEDLVHLDTADFRLWKAGWAIERSPDSWRLVGHRDGWKGEILCEVPSSSVPPEDPFEAWPQSHRDRLRSLIGSETLLESGILRTARREISILDENGKIVGRLEVTESSSADSGRSFHHLLLLPLKGFDEEARLLREWILEQGGAASDRGPLHRAFEGRGNGPSSLAEGRPRAVGFFAPGREAVRDYVRSQFESALVLVSPFSPEGDPELLHSHRVAMRRIRSVVSLLRGVFPLQQVYEMKAMLGEITHRSNRLRDLDVRLERREKLDSLVHESLRAGLESLWKEIAESRKREGDELVAYFDGELFGRHVKTLGALFDPSAVREPSPSENVPIGVLVLKKLARRYDRVLRQGEAILADAEPAALHALRIQCKKMRYLMDLVPPEVPAAPRAAILRGLKDLQAVLGDFNDLTLLEASLLEAARRPADPASFERSLAHCALAGSVRTMAHEKRREAVRVFSAFAHPSIRREVRSLSKWRKRTVRKGRISGGRLP